MYYYNHRASTGTRSDLTQSLLRCTSATRDSTALLSASSTTAWRCVCDMSYTLCTVVRTGLSTYPVLSYSLRTERARSCACHMRSRAWTARFTWFREAWVGSKHVASTGLGEIPSSPWQTCSCWDMRTTSWGRRYRATPRSSPIPSQPGECSSSSSRMGKKKKKKKKPSCGVCWSIERFAARTCWHNNNNYYNRGRSMSQKTDYRSTAPRTATREWRFAGAVPYRETIITTRHRDANWWTGKTLHDDYCQPYLQVTKKIMMVIIIIIIIAVRTDIGEFLTSLWI